MAFQHVRQHLQINSMELPEQSLNLHPVENLRDHIKHSVLTESPGNAEELE